ncbi:MAG: 4-alpha-glucanotransferase [Betaproteobacteria bacterium]|nr:4-alpha-glucanotransferase [Betaproteobacteria bacterium]
MSTPAQAALRRLGIERLVLSIHQASFPADTDDLGIGTPYSRRSRALLSFARDLGFTGIALGPGGITSRANASPYEGSLFSLNPSFLSLAPLVECGYLDAAQATGSRGDGTRADHARATDTSRAAIRQVRARLRGSAATHARELAAIDALARDPLVAAEAAFEGAAAATGTDDWRAWPAHPPEDESAADVFVVGQWLLRGQHARFLDDARALGMQIYGDAQVGVSHRDRYMQRGLFLADYRMGAPPSRTNPAGQPWNFPVPDPAQEEAVRSFVESRFAWLLATHDGLRLDHPHGWVCPWVYSTPVDEAAALGAVQSGARLFESPDLSDHPALARYARVRPDQIDRARARHDDEWVRSLEPAQVEAYSSQIRLLLECARANGVDERDVMVEVLSTCPRPLAAVLAHCGLGRFRITQKARVEVEGDVYRSDGAAPHDWIMAGNHDTPPLRVVVEGWRGTPECALRAEYLSRRLEPSPAARAAFARTLAGDTRAMSEAMLADLLVGPARRVMIFWADLFGEERYYNRGGEVHPENWTLRLPPDFEHAYARSVEAGTAPSLERAIRMALHARGLE